VRDVVKRGDERGGDINDAPHSGRPSKLTKANRKRVVEVVDENPRLSLREITNIADVGLSHLSVHKILSDSGFYLKIPRKKPFWRRGQQRRKEFAQRRRQWDLQQWRCVVFIDEATIEYDPCSVGKKVHVKPRKKLCKKN
jgi:transposase